MINSVCMEVVSLQSRQQVINKCSAFVTSSELYAEVTNGCMSESTVTASSVT